MYCQICVWYVVNFNMHSVNSAYKVIAELLFESTTPENLAVHLLTTEIRGIRYFKFVKV